jgi:hypothetical protein
MVGLDRLPDADVVVLQRPSRRWWVDIVPYLRDGGIKIVVDVDDRYDSILKDNVNAFDPVVEHIGAEWIDRVCKMADVVTCTTPALARRYGYGKAVILPNLVPAQYLVFPTQNYRASEPGKHVMGWPGLASHHPGDLKVTDGGVAAALEEDPSWQFRVPGDVRAVCEELGLRLPKPREVRTKDNLGREQVRGFQPVPDQLHQTGGRPFWDWPKLLGELEIGVVPLADNIFNAAKSCLKAMEMSALGIPVVMSPTPDNKRLHALGAGELASGRGQWHRRVRALMRSADYRQELGARGRAVMATQTYEEHQDRWLEAWEGRAETLAA